MALYIPHRVFHLAQLLYVRPENFGPCYICMYVCMYVCMYGNPTVSGSHCRTTKGTVNSEQVRKYQRPTSHLCYCV